MDDLGNPSMEVSSHGSPLGSSSHGCQSMTSTKGFGTFTSGHGIPRKTGEMSSIIIASKRAVRCCVHILYIYIYNVYYIYMPKCVEANCLIGHCARWDNLWSITFEGWLPMNAHDTTPRTTLWLGRLVTINQPHWKNTFGSIAKTSCIWSNEFIYCIHIEIYPSNKSIIEPQLIWILKIVNK